LAEIRHLENRHDVFFSADGGQIWIKFRRLVQNDVSTAIVVEIALAVKFQYGGRFGEFSGISFQSHVSHCRVLPLGEFTVTIPEPPTCHIAGCKNSTRHIENRFSPYYYYIYFCFYF